MAKQIMTAEQSVITAEPDLVLDPSKVVLNPDDAWFIGYLKPYYVITADGQYLFGTTHLGRRPDVAYYIIPPRLQAGQAPAGRVPPRDRPSAL